MAILGDSVDTMGSQYITSPNPTPTTPSSLPQRYSYPCCHFLVPSYPLAAVLPGRGSANELPRCRNSLGAGVIAATVFLERVIVQQRGNGIAARTGERERERGGAGERDQARWPWWGERGRARWQGTMRETVIESAVRRPPETPPERARGAGRGGLEPNGRGTQ